MKDLYLAGSTSYFKDIENFIPHDLDFIKIVDKNENNELITHYSGYSDKLNKHICVFSCEKKPVSEYIKYFEEKFDEHRTYFANFLNKNFAHEIGVKIEDLKNIKKYANQVIDKHKYLAKVLDFYIENNDWVLTKEQLNIVYKIYKNYADK